MPRGLTVYELEHAQFEFAARFADREELHLDFVADVANALREIGETADRLANISPFADRASERARLDRLDRERFGFRIAQQKSGTAERGSLLDLTNPARPAESRTFDQPPGWQDSPPRADPSRYSAEEDEDDVGAAEAMDVSEESDWSSSGDDADDIGFE